MSNIHVSSSKKARLDYGPDALEVTEDVSTETLEGMKTEYYNTLVENWEVRFGEIEFNICAYGKFVFPATMLCTWRHKIDVFFQLLSYINNFLEEIPLKNFTANRFFANMDWFQGSIGEAIQSAKLQKAFFVVVVHGKKKMK